MDTDYTIKTKGSDFISFKMTECNVSAKDLHQASLPSLFSPPVHPHLGTLVWGRESDTLRIHLKHTQRKHLTDFYRNCNCFS